LKVAGRVRKRVDRVKLRDRILAACRERIESEADLWPSASPAQRKMIVRAHVADMTLDYGRGRVTTDFYPIAADLTTSIQHTTLSRPVLNTEPIPEVYDLAGDRIVRPAALVGVA
jgi:hypothetical protein